MSLRSTLAIRPLARLATTAPPKVGLRALHPASSSNTTRRGPAMRQTRPAESPEYLLVPTPPQSTEEQRPRIRGSLPRPRPVFRKHEGARRAQPAYFEQTAPASKRARAPTAAATTEPVSESASRGAFNRLVSDARRQALRQGLTTLWARRKRFDVRRRAHQQREVVRKEAVCRESRHVEDRLTQPTNPQALLRTAVGPAPNELDVHLGRMQRVRWRDRGKVDARRSAIVELYANARTFIVTERDLLDRLETEFAPDRWSRLQPDAESIWDVHGMPPGIREMASHVHTDILRDDQTSGPTGPSAVFKQTQARLKTLAEDLTGGKID